MNNKAVIAMSGGVDSSVAAYLTLKGGMECIGITMKMFNNDDIGIEKKSTCCSLSDIEDARDVCYRMGINHYVLNFCDCFKKDVIDRFISTYKEGKTPNPCIDCNRYVKFKALLERAITLGYDSIVTGHYARIEKSGDRFLLKKAADLTKDQSYVLYSLTQHELKHTLFPLGELTKKEVREIADSEGFINAKKHDSQDICFAPDGYYDFISYYTGEKPKKGKFIDVNGNVLGTHDGILKYTIGQRKGLGIALGKPVYVCGIDPENNTVTLGEEKEIFKNTLTAENINLITSDKLTEPLKVKAKIRYRQDEQPATVYQTGEDEIKVVFDENVRAITTGQAVVLYDGDYVVGGGTVTGE